MSVSRVLANLEGESHSNRSQSSLRDFCCFSFVVSQAVRALRVTRLILKFDMSGLPNTGWEEIGLLEEMRFFKNEKMDCTFSSYKEAMATSTRNDASLNVLCSVCEFFSASLVLSIT